MTTTATTAPPTVFFSVLGVPETEGSTRAFPTQTGGVRVTHTKRAALEEWRARVRAASLSAAVQARWPLGYDGPVEVRATFYLPRPKRPTSPLPAVKPDLDKLARAVGDALAEVRRGGAVAQRGMLREDSRIVRWQLSKEYVDGEAVTSPGAAIAVLPITQEDLMTHPLDPALETLNRASLYVRLPLNLLDLARRVGELTWEESGHPGGRFAQPSDSRGAKHVRNRLLNIVRYCASWASAAGVADPEEAMREEYDRARVLHPGMTLDSPEPTDAQRLAALVEELGEVARATTYDAQTDRGHAGSLDTELIQLGALAAAWATRYTTEEA